MALNNETWKQAHDNIMINTLLQEKTAGRQAQSGWKWVAVSSALADVDVTKTVEQCKNRWQLVSLSSL
jgi:hypothetical protein